ncbi:MAG: tyrosine-type recombinase/integrase [Pseudomonadota bacterium]|nr:tyrosine-type recombinase/integrase [Pseudomonadota bacterium]
MKSTSPNTLARALREFLGEHLPALRGMSPHTICSYRDSLSLLLRFVAADKRRPVDALDIVDIGPHEVVAFLKHLEQERHNTPATRNVRLAAIHAFFRFLAAQDPRHLEQCQRVLGVPFKRTRIEPVAYLEYEEIQAVLATIDRTTPDGQRDYLLLATMFNTGARAQEMLNLRPFDFQLVRPYQVRLFGKGNKERICPLWSETAKLLRSFLASRKLPPHAVDPLFVNHRKEPLTRFGLRYILAKYCKRACESTPTLRHKRLHPHSMRHSTAIHLLKAGVDPVTISHWLGHASVNTTNRYAMVDLEMKRAAIAKAKPVGAKKEPAAAWRRNASILEWLESL